MFVNVTNSNVKYLSINLKYRIQIQLVALHYVIFQMDIIYKTNPTYWSVYIFFYINCKYV